MTTVGIIGSGHIGTAIAQLAIKAGYQVVISNSRGAETLAGPGRPKGRKNTRKAPHQPVGKHASSG